MRRPNLKIKFVYLGAYGLMFAFFGIGIAISNAFDHRIGGFITGAAIIPFLTMIIAAGVWIYDAWAAIPGEFRKAALIKEPTPGVAVGMHLVPCVNLIWLFDGTTSLAHSINRALDAQGSTTVRASHHLAIAAAIFHLVPYCNYLLGPALWFYLMHSFDKARGEIRDFDVNRYVDVF